MNVNSKTEISQLRKFEASRFWQSNVYGAMVAGIGGAVVLCVLAGMVVYMAHGLDVLVLAGAMLSSVILGFLCLFPGNLVAAYPYAVEVEEGKGLRIFAPLKNIYIPLDNVKEVRWSWLTVGWRVKLNKRLGALTSFTIHAGFGSQGKELARAIQEEIDRNGPALPVDR